MKVSAILVGVTLLAALFWHVHPKFTTTVYIKYSLYVFVHFTWCILKWAGHLIGVFFTAYAITRFYHGIYLCYHSIMEGGDAGHNYQVESDGAIATGSGDHDEFFDFPEIFIPQREHDTSEHCNTSLQHHRIRRRRMISTLAQDNLIFNTTMRDSRDEIRKALLELFNNKKEFLTPFTTPKFLTPHSTPKFWTPSPSQNQSRSSSPVRQSNPTVENDTNNNNNFDDHDVVEELKSKSSEAIKIDMHHDDEIVNSEDTDLNGNNNIRTNIRISLHQFPRGLTKPCLSIDAMFVETFIRLIGIPCNIVCDCLDTTGPWITWQQKKVCGMIDCMKLLKQLFPEITNIFTVDGDRHILACSIRLVLENLSCLQQSCRWIFEDGEELKLYQPGWRIICKDHQKLSKTIKETLWIKGFGQKSYEELSLEIVENFASLSMNLGTKQFLMGDTPTEIDCRAFSILCQVMWSHDSILRDQLRGFNNLAEYCKRTRELLWSDWQNDHFLLGYQNNGEIKPSLINSEDDDHINDADVREEGQSENSTHFCNKYYQLVPSDNESFSANQMTQCKMLKQSPQMHDQVIDGWIDEDFDDMQQLSYSTHQNGNKSDENETQY